MHPSLARQSIRSRLRKIRLFHPSANPTQNRIPLPQQTRIRNRFTILLNRQSHKAIRINARSPLQRHTLPRNPINKPPPLIPRMRQKKIDSLPRMKNKLRPGRKPPIKSRQHPRHPSLRPRILLRGKDRPVLRHTRENAPKLKIQSLHPERNNPVPQKLPILPQQPVHVFLCALCAFA